MKNKTIPAKAFKSKEALADYLAIDRKDPLLDAYFSMLTARSTAVKQAVSKLKFLQGFELVKK